MAYKKYIKRGGKIYGPYIYHSRREDGKVISEYHGTSKKAYKPSYKKISLAFVGLLALIAITYLAFNIENVFTGRAVMDIDAEYSEGIISGQLILSHQNELTNSSRLVFENNGKTVFETGLESFLYPEVYFNLIILTDQKDLPIKTEDSKDSFEPTPTDNLNNETEILTNQTVENNSTDTNLGNETYITKDNSTSDEEDTGNEIDNSINSTEDNSESNTNGTEDSVDTTNPEDSGTETTDDSTSSTEEDSNEVLVDSDSEEGAPITGGAISGGIKMISGSITKGKIFSYKLKNNEKFNGIDKGSVRTDIEKLNENVLKTQINNQKIIISTEYAREKIIIDLTKLNLTLEEGLLKIKLLEANGFETSSITLNISTMEIIDKIVSEESTNETAPYLNEIAELTPEERKALEANFGNNSIKTKNAVSKNGFLIVTYTLGSYESEFSYNPELSKEILETFAKRDRDKWVKDIAKDILRDKPTETKIT
ncbi:MAG: hypothetical protein KKC19_03965, partial [Nanoarchaeota archaeon]|nr:hypothetical protein [Nanoarchaeota archaeon]